jgi:dihydrofolate synthase/folylpolyglutamate synthase
MQNRLQAFMGYRSSIAYLYGLQKYGIKFGLTSISQLLSALGNPHHRIRCVHIAGTNGKGSTAAFIASILAAAGYKTGLYTSPHLISFTERITINNREISHDSVARLTGHIRDAASPLDSITFFECATAMAFTYFAEQKVDCAVIETGMGGRLDATNVIQPILSVITTISREHELYLGNTVLQIAKEKAGIIKRNGVLLTAVRNSAVLRLFRERCRRMKSAMYVLDRDFDLQRQPDNTLAYRGLARDIRRLQLGLRGEHQFDNGALALAAAEVLGRNGFAITDAALRRGLKTVSWPGRLETARSRPLVVFDGAHNPAAMRCLRKSILNDFDYDRMLLVLGIMHDKDIRAMLKEIIPIAGKVFLCRPCMDRAASTAELARMLQNSGMCCVEMESVNDALLRALREARRHDLVCITGSLFTVGEAKAAFARLTRATASAGSGARIRT